MKIFLKHFSLWSLICWYSRRSAAGSARTKVTRCHMFFFFFFLLLLLLLLLFPVKYFRPKTPKHTVFSNIFMPVEEKTLVLTLFLQAKIVQKHRFFSERASPSPPPSPSPPTTMTITVSIYIYIVDFILLFSIGGCPSTKPMILISCHQGTKLEAPRLERHPDPRCSLWVALKRQRFYAYRTASTTGCSLWVALKRQQFYAYRTASTTGCSLWVALKRQRFYAYRTASTTGCSLWVALKRQRFYAYRTASTTGCSLWVALERQRFYAYRTASTTGCSLWVALKRQRFYAYRTASTTGCSLWVALKRQRLNAYRTASTTGCSLWVALKRQRFYAYRTASTTGCSLWVALKRQRFYAYRTASTTGCSLWVALEQRFYAYRTASTTGCSLWVALKRQRFYAYRTASTTGCSLWVALKRQRLNAYRTASTTGCSLWVALKRQRFFVQMWSLRRTVCIEWNHQRKSSNAIFDFGFNAQLRFVNTIAIIYHHCETTKKNKCFFSQNPIQPVQRDLARSWASLDSPDAAAADLHEGTDPCVNSCHDNNAIGGERWRFHSQTYLDPMTVKWVEPSVTSTKKQLQLHLREWYLQQRNMAFTSTNGDTWVIPLRFLYILVLAMPEDSLWPLNILFNILWTYVHK